MKDGMVQPKGFHADFKNPIPEPGVEYPLSYPDYVISEIPTHITGISPASVTEGSQDTVLTLKGNDFVTTSEVQVRGKTLKTEFVDKTQLKATVPAEMLKNVDTLPVRVVHRAPGWGNTNTVFLIVKYR